MIIPAQTRARILEAKVVLFDLSNSVCTWNHRIPEQLGLPGQGHLEQVPQERVRVGLGCLQTGTLPTFPGQLIQSSATLMKKSSFLMLGGTPCILVQLL